MCHIFWYLTHPHKIIVIIMTIVMLAGQGHIETRHVSTASPISTMEERPALASMVISIMILMIVNIIIVIIITIIITIVIILTKNNSLLQACPAFQPAFFAKQIPPLSQVSLFA